jgi:hypothetical protein
VVACSVVLGAYEVHNQVDLGYDDTTKGDGEEEERREEPVYLCMSEQGLCVYIDLVGVPMVDSTR